MQRLPSASEFIRINAAVMKFWQEAKGETTYLIAEATRELSVDRALPVSLQGLIFTWSAFVADVSAGFDDVWWTYAGLMQERDDLQSLIDISGQYEGSLQAIIEPIDRRFRDATRPISKNLFSGDLSQRTFWWMRVPVKPGPDLAESILRETYLGSCDEGKFLRKFVSDETQS